MVVYDGFYYSTYLVPEWWIFSDFTQIRCIQLKGTADLDADCSNRLRIANLAQTCVNLWTFLWTFILSHTLPTHQSSCRNEIWMMSYPSTAQFHTCFSQHMFLLSKKIHQQPTEEGIVWIYLGSFEMTGGSANAVRLGRDILRGTWTGRVGRVKGRIFAEFWGGKTLRQNEGFRLKCDGADFWWDSPVYRIQKKQKDRYL